MKKLKGLEFVITAKSSTIDRASDFDIDVTDLHVYSDGGGGGVLTVAGDLCHENIEFLLWKIILLTTSSLFVQGMQFFFYLYEAIIRWRKTYWLALALSYVSNRCRGPDRSKNILLLTCDPSNNKEGEGRKDSGILIHWQR